MVVLGVVTAVLVDYYKFPLPHDDRSFLSVQLADMLNFAVLGGGAIAVRKAPDAHKRLIIFATICISDAGFSRWWGPGLERLLADGSWGSCARIYLSDLLLIALVGAYDVFSRRRMYPAYVFGAIWGRAVEFGSIWLYVRPWWKSLATALIGR